MSNKLKTLTYKGKTKTLKEWANELHLTVQTISRRIKKGLPLEPYKHLITYQGVTKPIREWAKELNISVLTINYRLKRGLPLNHVLSPVKRQGKYKQTSLDDNGKRVYHYSKRDMERKNILSKLRFYLKSETDPTKKQKLEEAIIKFGKDPILKKQLYYQKKIKWKK